MNFTSTEQKTQVHDVPYFEDSKAKDARYYSSTKTPAKAKSEVELELQQLGAYDIKFAEGYFGKGKERRYGYLVTFGWNGARGKIPLAGLPSKSLPYYNPQKEKKIARIRVQALLILRDHLISYRQSPIFITDSMPMLQHLIVDGERTLAEYLQQMGTLPVLPATTEVDFIEGEITEL